jgi:RimJ/RimL family protein N-acetyltransferase
MRIKTQRLLLRPWQSTDLLSFVELHADREVMHDYGGPLDRDASAQKLQRYRNAFERHLVCRFALETHAGDFIGYAGVMPAASVHPLGPHFDIGWRLRRSAWGQGYATEAARASLDDAFLRLGPEEILAYAAPGNRRSLAVMHRLGLRRDPDRDFTTTYDGYGQWHGLVWVAKPA